MVRWEMLNKIVPSPSDSPSFLIDTYDKRRGLDRCVELRGCGDSDHMAWDANGRQGRLGDMGSHV